MCSGRNAYVCGVWNAFARIVIVLLVVADDGSKIKWFVIQGIAEGGNKRVGCSQNDSLNEDQDARVVKV